MQVKFEKLYPDAKVPQYAHEDDSGLDLHAYLDDGICTEILPGFRRLVKCGISIAIPSIFHEAQIRPRSGLALKHGITVLNAPGTIDAGYRGEIGVILYNAGSEPFIVSHGDKIAQMVFCPITKVEMVEGDLDETTRGSGGFGSTGV